MKPVIATFKETLASLQDLKYGQIILQKSVGQALWYWTKYLLLIIAIGVILAIAALTYYAPQLPKILGDQIPDVDLTITSGIASTTVKQPFTAGDDKFIFILDTTGKLEDLDKYPAGVLILEDKVVAKKDSADIRIYPLKDFPDGTFTKDIVLNWVKNNQLLILGLGAVALLLFAVFITGFTWIWKLGGMAIFALLVWLASRVIKRTISLADSLKLVLYASVLPTLVGTVSVLSPNSQISSIIQLALLLLYSLGWLWYLPAGKPAKSK